MTENERKSDDRDEARHEHEHPRAAADEAALSAALLAGEESMQAYKSERRRQNEEKWVRVLCADAAAHAQARADDEECSKDNEGYGLESGHT